MPALKTKDLAEPASQTKASTSTTSNSTSTSTSLSALTDTQTSGFFRLSAELRNRIYEPLIPRRYNVERGAGLRLPGFVWACKQMYIDNSQLYYNRIAFHFADVELCRRFLSQLSITNKKALSVVRLEAAGAQHAYFCRYAEYCPGSETFGIHHTMDQYRDAKETRLYLEDAIKDVAPGVVKMDMILRRTGRESAEVRASWLNGHVDVPLKRFWVGVDKDDGNSAAVMG